MRIKNANVFCEDGVFRPGDVTICGEYISEKKEKTEETEEESIFDAGGAYLIPGLIDIHFHGCMGVDFCDGNEDSIAKIAQYQLHQGITAICPATMTYSEEKLHKIMRAAAGYSGKDGADLVGINMEGPFLSPTKKGAQKEKEICLPDVEMFRRLQKSAGGLIKLVDVAPERKGAMEFIEAVSGQVTVSIAHTTADYETAIKALEKGACHVTHLYNAMPPYSHRAPGVIGAARDKKCDVELICDGVHIHPSVIRGTFAMFGAEHIILISDSMEACGLGEGVFALGGQAVTVLGNRSTLTGSDTIAGSVTNLMGCVKYAVKQAGIPLETAILCATKNPARAVGIENHYGSIQEGRYANLVLLDSDFNVLTVFHRGKEVK